MSATIQRYLFPLLLAGCAPATMLGGMRSDAVVESGSTLLVQLDEPIGPATGAFTTGRFTATLIEPARTAGGEILIPAGATLTGTVIDRVVEQPGLPVLAGLAFDRLEIGQASFELNGTITEVDVALADDDAPGPLARSAPADSRAAFIPGTIIEHPENVFGEIGTGEELGTVVSLGPDPGSALPIGTRMRVQVQADLSLTPTL